MPRLLLSLIHKVIINSHCKTMHDMCLPGHSSRFSQVFTLA